MLLVLLFLIGVEGVDEGVDEDGDFASIGVGEGGGGVDAIIGTTFFSSIGVIFVVD